MVMVLCEVSDIAALWAANRLRARDVPVDIVTAPVLGSALRWEHRLSADGEASVTIDLGDGRTVSNGSPGGVLNRLSFVPTERLDRVGGADRDYAVQEMNALFLSWLNAMPGPLVNRPSPQGLGGAWRHRSSWIALAGAAGLPTAPYRQSSADDPAEQWSPQPPAPVTVFAVGERAVAPAGTPQPLQEGCLRLAKAAGEVLLGVDFAFGADGQLAVVNASAVPDLSRGGEPLIDALKQVLTP
jgi:hypothetical protein